MYLYDKDGKYIITIDKGTEEQIKQQYGQDVIISYVHVGQSGIVENGTIREKTILEKVEAGEYEFMPGEFVKDGELVLVQKPDNYHFWDSKKNVWVYDKELEINALPDEILNLETELLTKYDEYDKAVARKLRTLEKKLNSDIEELRKKIEQKYKRLEELESEG